MFAPLHQFNLFVSIVFCKSRFPSKIVIILTAVGGDWQNQLNFDPIYGTHLLVASKCFIVLIVPVASVQVNDVAAVDVVFDVSQLLVEVDLGHLVLDERDALTISQSGHSRPRLLQGQMHVQTERITRNKTP